MFDPSDVTRILMLVDAKCSHRPGLIAIDGPSSAGKTTLASELMQARADLSVVHLDDFYAVLYIEEMARFGPEEGFRRFFAWERLRDEVLASLSRGDAAHYQKYDWSLHQLGDWASVEASGPVIVEGVYSSRPELRDYYCATVFVETPLETRLARSLARGAHDFGFQALSRLAAQNHGFWLAKWMASEDWYLEHLQPRETADIVVSGAGTPTGL